MAEGVKNPNVILTIGFLNNKIEENLEKYKVGFIISSNQSYNTYIHVIFQISYNYYIYLGKLWCCFGWRSNHGVPPGHPRGDQS